APSPASSHSACRATVLALPRSVPNSRPGETRPKATDHETGNSRDQGSSRLESLPQSALRSQSPQLGSRCADSNSPTRVDVAVNRLPGRLKPLVELLSSGRKQAPLGTEPARPAGRPHARRIHVDLPHLRRHVLDSIVNATIADIREPEGLPQPIGVRIAFQILALFLGFPGIDQASIPLGDPIAVMNQGSRHDRLTDDAGTVLPEDTRWIGRVAVLDDNQIA